MERSAPRQGDTSPTSGWRGIYEKTADISNYRVERGDSGMRVLDMAVSDVRRLCVVGSQSACDGLERVGCIGALRSFNAG